MKFIFEDLKELFALRHFGQKLLIVVFACGLLLIFQASLRAQPIITCTPTPPPAPTPAPDPNQPVYKTMTIPYSISYGFRTTDRNYDKPNDLSKQIGTLSFTARLFEKQLRVRVANQNFIIGRDSSGERAVNFGNTSLGATLVLNKLQESTSWQARRFYPSLSFDYEAGFPTGSRSRGINFGRVDHTFTFAIAKKLGKKLAIKNAQGDLNNLTFARRTAGELNFGLSMSGNLNGGYKKTGTFVARVSHVLGDISRSKYTYSSEVSFLSLSHKARASVRTLNSLSIVLDDSGTTLGLGFIAGVTKGAPRTGFNVSIRFENAFKIRKRIN